jgi:hypothetical protein
MITKIMLKEFERLTGTKFGGICYPLPERKFRVIMCQQTYYQLISESTIREVILKSDENVTCS